MVRNISYVYDFHANTVISTVKMRGPRKTVKGLSFLQLEGSPPPPPPPGNLVKLEKRTKPKQQQRNQSKTKKNKTKQTKPKKNETCVV